MKTMKKILAVLLAVLMCVTVLPFAFAADEPCEHEESSNYGNVCSKCFGYMGSYDLKVGDNTGFQISDNGYRMVRFVPEKAATYKFTSISDGTDPWVALYEVADGDDGKFMKWLGEYDDSDNYDFCLEYNFNVGQTYYLVFGDSRYEDKNQYTVKLEEVCVHSGTEQNCCGYICDNCGEYFGEKDKTKHSWSDGYCRFCYESHDHTGCVVDGVCTVCNAQMAISVTTNGVTEYYGNFEHALSNTEDGSVVKLLKNYVSGGESIVINKAITLDLNGNTWDRISSDQINVNADANIINSGSGGDCTLTIHLNSAGATVGNGRYWRFTTTCYDSVEKHLPDCAAIYKDDGTQLDMSSSNATPTYTWINVKSDHTYGDITEAKAATCLATGNDAYKQCSACKKYFSADATVNSTDGKELDDFKRPALGHNFGDIVPAGYSDSCAEDDVKISYKYCDQCELYYKSTAGDTEPIGNGAKDISGFVIAAMGHSFESIPYEAPTCTSYGHEAFKRCANCNKCFAADADKFETNGTVDGEEFYIPPTGHDFTGDMKIDADGKDGTHSYACANGCGQYGNVTAHTWDNGTLTKPATHTEEGKMTYTCACGGSYISPIAKIKDHTYNATVVEPTCTQEGYTVHTCACGDSYKDNYVDALGHNYKDGVCAECGDKDPNYTGDQGGNTGDDASNCDCMCHSSSKFVQFFYKIFRLFWKLFKIHKTCDCGAVHY